MSDNKMVAEIIFESYATIAFRKALEYVDDDGFVASMPQLLARPRERALRQYHLKYLIQSELRGKYSHYKAG